jgi:hypothetical protein
MHPLETYLRELRDIRSTGAGVNETSYYPPLANLLNAVGHTLKPRVRCIINLRNIGAGLPDGGLFTPNQFQRRGHEPLAGQKPERGAIECKGTKDDAWVTADGEQVSEYWNEYRQVLVTNYRDFVLVGQDDNGKPVKRETFRLAPDEKAFWKAAAHPAALAESHGERFLDYLKRVMLHAAPLADPKDVAWFLASYARDARARMALAELPALATVRQAIEEALGLKFEGDKGDHFFRSTLVQTLFYGVFSAWVLWHRTHPKAGERFDWEKSAKYLHVPILRKLFRELADPVQLDEWKLAEVLDWTAGVLHRVDRAAFFAKFQDAEAVQYFYEPFLEAFDPELRKQLGVWYTPPEIVKYMVARVDTVLRDDLKRPDGLADKDVYILDPCCGTGAYLVEVLRTIASTLRDKGEDALLGSKLKAAATTRVFGFEILPAPFVVSHLQLGLFLQSEGVPLQEAKKERAVVFLTNALTGWEPPKGPKQSFLFTEMEEEHDRAEAVKQRTPILVVLGNPPYNGFAGVAVEEERDLSDAYRWKGGDPEDLKPQGQGLNDLYVRFFRMAERCIVERGLKQGIVCFISNYSWLDGRSFPLMRHRYADEFDSVWIDSLNGDKYRTGKLTPDGEPDPSVFSTEHNREGIQVGTAITLLVREVNHHGLAQVRFRDLWGQSKRADLLLSLKQSSSRIYRELIPERPLGLPFRPQDTGKGYLKWPLLAELFPVSFPGVQSKQDNLVIDIDRNKLERRIRDYFDGSITDKELAEMHPGAMDGSNACKPGPTRAYLLKRGLLEKYFLPILYKSFDVRWIYWEPETGLLGRKSPGLFRNAFKGNAFIEARQRESIADWSRGSFSSILCDNFGNGFSNFFPMYIRDDPSDPQFPEMAARAVQLGGTHSVDGKVTRVILNLSSGAAVYLSSKAAQHADLFYHALAILHSPSYRSENAGALRQDWPRVPLPHERERLIASAMLGKHIGALLDTEAAVAAVTAGNIRAELKSIGAAARVGGGQLDAGAADFDVTARWGVAGKAGVTMPSTGRLTERDYTAVERTALAKGAAALGLDEFAMLACLGEKTCDVFLNDVAYWRNVPAKVWSYTLGGYQVMKKWLSYREKALLGRALSIDEVTEVTHMARRIAALLLLQPALDANYRAVKAAAYSWPA